MPRLSYVNGSSTKPLIGETIGRIFDAVCADHPERLALVSCHQRVRWTYAELKERVDALAAGLVALQLLPGDRVGIWAPNCWEWLVTQYATAKVGLILVNINPAYRLSEVEFALGKVQCKALITASQLKTSDYVAMLYALAPEIKTAGDGPIRASKLPKLEHVITLGEAKHDGFRRFSDLFRLGNQDDRERVSAIANDLQFDDPINIQFTSGTTGVPKGATLSHHNILNNGFFVGETIGLKPGEKVCAPVPLYHCFGMVMANLACLTHAACVVYPAEMFDPVATLAAVESEACTALYGVPTMFIAMLNNPEFNSFYLNSLRTGIVAGAPCPIEIMRQVIDRMHMPQITIAYGMTETSPVSFQSNLEDSIDRRVTSVGRVHPHLEVKIIDEQGRIVPVGTAGELCTRGYSVMQGYWDEPEKTSEALDPAGWMHTGDLAEIDDNNYCNIVGRIKDMVIRGGENIYPREIEEFLYRHPAIQDAQVIGVPDQQYGEELCAWVVLKPKHALDAVALRAFCSEQIAHYKIPRYVRFVESFPTTVTGKVRKVEMRETMIAELGLIVDQAA
jgi:Acyl-CoA synthetases (AMP-forming)/AMP-acid ligases II